MKFSLEEEISRLCAERQTEWPSWRDDIEAQKRIVDDESEENDKAQFCSEWYAYVEGWDA